jgi:ribosomal-protein-alanine N-acetyltransferase
MTPEISKQKVDFSSLGMISFKGMDADSAAAVLRWQYDAPYDFYNFAAAGMEREIHSMLAPENHFFSLQAESGEVIAYCCFGREGQVPGGDYAESALDIGLMLRPDLTGRGLGRPIARQVVTFGSSRWPAKKCRVTIAAFNDRALRVWQALGFVSVARFVERGTNTQFHILIKEWCAND